MRRGVGTETGLEVALTAVGDLGGEAHVAGEADEVEWRVFVVVLWHAPFDGSAGARAGEELGEGLHLRPPVVQEPVVEYAQVPHLCFAARPRPLTTRATEKRWSAVPWLASPAAAAAGEGIKLSQGLRERKGKKPTKTPGAPWLTWGAAKMSAFFIHGLGLHKHRPTSPARLPRDAQVEFAAARSTDHTLVG